MEDKKAQFMENMLLKKFYDMERDYEETQMNQGPILEEIEPEESIREIAARMKLEREAKSLSTAEEYTQTKSDSEESEVEIEIHEALKNKPKKTVTGATSRGTTTAATEGPALQALAPPPSDLVIPNKESLDMLIKKAASFM